MSDCSATPFNVPSFECVNIPNSISEIQLTKCQFEIWRATGWVYLESIDEFIKMRS
jgi:hypothetical protein